MAVNGLWLALAVAAGLVVLNRGSGGAPGDSLLGGLLGGGSGGPERIEVGMGALADAIFPKASAAQSVDEDIGIAPALTYSAIQYESVPAASPPVVSIGSASAPVILQDPVQLRQSVTIKQRDDGGYYLAGGDNLTATTPIDLTQRVDLVSGNIVSAGFGLTGDEGFSSTPATLAAAIAAWIPDEGPATTVQGGGSRVGDAIARGFSQADIDYTMFDMGRL